MLAKLWKSFIRNMLFLYHSEKINILEITIGQIRRFTNPVNQIDYSLRSDKSMFIVRN